MLVLGLNAFHADASAALLRDGVLVAATEEERFTRVKHWAGFPQQSVRFCLGEAGVGLDEIEHITIGRDPRAKFLRKLAFLARHPALAWGAVQRLANGRAVTTLEDHFGQVDPAAVPERVRARIRHIEHHRSHLASAFYASPFEEAALLSIDGSGDFTTTMIGVGRGTRIEVLGSVDFPASVGLLYTAFTQFLGFPAYGDEYKVMGLAPYGEPRFLEQVMKIVRLRPDGLFGWDERYFVPPSRAGFEYVNHVPRVGNLYSARFVAEFGPPRRPDEPLTSCHHDLAASVQRAAEAIAFHVLRALRARTGLARVCVAGGVAQNSVANGKIAEACGFDAVYVPPAGHDAGNAMGSALYHYHHVLGHGRVAPLQSACTGMRFGNGEIEALLQRRGVAYRRLDEPQLLAAVVDKLTEPGVVGWFHGRAEFGPRALGARSILADPRNPHAKDLLNLRIKRRESFRPFAPSVLREHMGEWFTREEAVPFMEKVLPIRPERRAAIPAVTHVDGTGRLQTVDREAAPRYHALIECFRQRTGVPMLLNTSFNESEPIVNTPEEALDCFLRTRMDMLVLEDCVVERSGA
jgi:carbamoyltransferase